MPPVVRRLDAFVGRLLRRALRWLMVAIALLLVLTYTCTPHEGRQWRRTQATLAAGCVVLAVVGLVYVGTRRKP